MFKKHILFVILCDALWGEYSNAAMVSSLSPSISVSGLDLVNAIETKPLCASSSNLTDHNERMNPIDFGGQKSRSQ